MKNELREDIYLYLYIYIYMSSCQKVLHIFWRKTSSWIELKFCVEIPWDMNYHCVKFQNGSSYGFWIMAKANNFTWDYIELFRDCSHVWQTDSGQILIILIIKYIYVYIYKNIDIYVCIYASLRSLGVYQHVFTRQFFL